MKTRNMARFLVVLSITALILTAGAYIVIASPPPPAASRLGPVAVSSSAPEWSSGWVTIAQGELRTFTHALGALGLPPERYGVELWFQDVDGGLGINRRYYGGVEINGNLAPWRGAHWQNLTTDTIQIKRGPDDDVADMVNVRVWVVPPAVPPDAYDSGWRSIAPNTMRVFTHGLGITATDLTVGLWFSDPVRGIHNFAYGGLTIDPMTETIGAFWHHLTTQTVQVTRYPSDTAVHQVRVSVVKGVPPAYDSRWQPVTPGQKLTLTHDLNWSPDMLLVRGECYTPTLGIHQRSAGGDHVGTPPDAKWVGADLENMTTTTVVVYRQSGDVVCGDFRVRVWKRSMTIYLPAVLRDYQ